MRGIIESSDPLFSPWAMTRNCLPPSESPDACLGGIDLGTSLPWLAGTGTGDWEPDSLSILFIESWRDTGVLDRENAFALVLCCAGECPPLEPWVEGAEVKFGGRTTPVSTKSCSWYHLCPGSVRSSEPRGMHASPRNSLPILAALQTVNHMARDDTSSEPILYCNNLLRMFTVSYVASSGSYYELCK